MAVREASLRRPERGAFMWTFAYALTAVPCGVVLGLPLLVALGLGGGSCWEGDAVSAALLLPVVLLGFAGDLCLKRGHVPRGPAACRTLVTVVSAGAAAVLAVTDASGFGIPVAVSCAAAVAVGVAAGADALRFASSLAKLSPGTSAFALAAAGLLDTCLAAGSYVLGTAWAVVVGVALLPVAAWTRRLIVDHMPSSMLAAPGSRVPEVLGTYDSAKGWRAAVMLGTCDALAVAVMLCAAFWSEGALPPVGTVVVLVFVTSIAASAFVLGVGNAPRTFSLTLLFRIVFPVLGCAVLVCAFFPSWSACAAAMGLWVVLGMGLASMFIGASLVRSGGQGVPYGCGVGPSLYRVVAFHTLGVAASLASAGTAVQAEGVVPVLLCCSVVAMVAFVECVPTFEPRFVGAARATVSRSVRDLPDQERNRYAQLVEHYGLTAREGEVFVRLLSDGDAQAIANELHVSRATVNTHIQHVYAKCGVHARAELKARAGLVEGT